ncbi:MAG: hypothetical protein H7Y03_01765 [Chitinophagaceae bacterium]|nr:hypothetical protein [Chitinophagaceae bacterium]
MQTISNESIKRYAPSKMRKQFFVLLTGLLGFLNGNTQQLIEVDPVAISPGALWEKGFQSRLNKLLYQEDYKVNFGDANSDPDAGKRAWPLFLPELYKARHDSARVNQLIATTGEALFQSKWAGSFFKPFTLPGYTMYYFQYKHLLPASQRAHTRKHLNDKGWEYLQRVDGYMDPIYLPPNFPQGTEFNSENFNWMARMGGYLFAEEYEDAEKMQYFGGYIRNWVRALYNAGRVEWNSNNYWGHTFNPLLSLHSNAKDADIRKMARAGLDWMVTEAALHYLDGFFAAGDVRAKPGAYKPFAGSVWGYNYLYFTDSLNKPSYKEDFTGKDLKDFIGMTPYSTYRPAQVLIDIAQRKFKLPLEIHSAKPFYHLDNDDYADWKGNTSRSARFEFETIYMNTNYTLVSLASKRPDGRLGTFSEESLWRLSVKGSDNGAIQVIGNSGEMTTMAGRWPYEEIAQFRNVMIRTVTKTDNIWVAMPEGVKVEYSGNRVFANMGNGVYTAYIPCNSKGISNGMFTYDSHYRLYTWKFNKTDTGALALEVGTVGEFGSYKKFKEAITLRSSFTKTVNGLLSYKAANGNVIDVKYMPLATYELHIPLAKDNPPFLKGTKTITAAGVLPKVWANGKLVDYEKWNSYEVDFGDNIVFQKWGSGSMILQSATNGLKVVVDPATAKISYFKFTPVLRK